MGTTSRQTRGSAEMVSARAAALHALVALEKGQTERLRSALDEAKLVGREQALAFELAHGVLRRERFLDHVLAPFAHRGLPKEAPLRSALRLGAYQLMFVGGMPAHAAVHETVDLVRSNKGFANALLRRVADCVELRPADPNHPTTQFPLSPTRSVLLPQPLPENEIERLGIVHSLPYFLLQRWTKDFGVEGLRQIAEAASAVPGVFLRAVGISRDELLAELTAAEVQCELCENPRQLLWTGGNSPFGSKAFAAGKFVVQDPTALAAAEAVPCKPGDTVVDLCAAPGTKTSLLAERVRPAGGAAGGMVHAFDIDSERSHLIHQNVVRLGLQEFVRIARAASQLPVADAVLADVPCSNSGVLGRRVEVRRRLTGTTISRLVIDQKRLLVQAINLCKPGGHVVYSTCSIDREENDGVVDAVLGSPGVPLCEVLSRHLTLPLAGKHDGGFYAVLRRALPASPGDG